MKSGLLERILTKLHGSPEKGDSKDAPSLLWKPDDWEYSALLYKGMTWDREARVRFGPLQEIYGDAIGGDLMGGALRLALLEDKYLYSLFPIDLIWDCDGVQGAREIDPNVCYFMHEEDLLYYGVKDGRLYVYDEEKDDLTDLGPLEPALERLASTLEYRTEPARRRARTHAKLKELGVPFHPGVPVIESDRATELRTPEEVGVRMVCLNCVTSTADNLDDKTYKEYLRKHSLWKHLTPSERRFMTNPVKNKAAANKFGWRAEALFLLMWATGLVAELPLPTRELDQEIDMEGFPRLDETPWPFIRSVELRPKSDILDAADLIYRYHWALRAARFEGDPPPRGLDPGMVVEWHYAINWLRRYDNADWDHVTTDT